MARIAIAFGLFALLAACEPSPQEAMLQQACQAGDVQACGILVEADSDRRARLGAALQGMSMNSNNNMTTTNCTPTGMGGMICNTF